MDGRFDERVDPRGLGGGIRKPVGGNNFSDGGAEKFQCVKRTDVFKFSAAAIVMLSEAADTLTTLAAKRSCCTPSKTEAARGRSA